LLPGLQEGEAVHQDTPFFRYLKSHHASAWWLFAFSEFLQVGAMRDWSTAKAPSLDDFERLAADAWARVPGEFRRLCTDLVIRVDDICDDAAVLKDLGLESGYELSGLYFGRDLAHRSVSDTPHGMDFVFLYRLPILAEWAESDELLGDLIGHVLVHEVAHHFGFSDDDIARIELADGSPGA
jgi:predicted Zn-dependent protease with MMP-like domain